MNRKNFVMSVLGVTMILISTPIASYSDTALPDKPIRIVVGYPAGSATDVGARIIAHGLQQRLGQAVMVENRVGGSGEVGAAYVSRAKADGTTLIYASASLVIQQALKDNPTLPVLESFSPIAMTASLPQFIVTNSSLGVSDLKGLIQKLKDEGDAHYYSSSGLGGIQHVLLDALTESVGVNLKHVPFAGGEPSRMDLIAGRSSLTSLSPDKMNDPAIKILAVVSESRHPDFPNIPTVAEAGVPELMEISSWLTWYAVLGPMGIPNTAASKLNAEISAVMADPEVSKQFAALGQTVMNGFSLERTTDFFEEDVHKWNAAKSKISIDIK